MLTRRSAVKGFAAAAGTTALATSTVFSPLPVIASRQSNASIEIGLPLFLADPAHPAMQLIDTFNAKGNGVQVTGTNYGANYEETMQRAQANISAGIGPAIVVTGWKYALFADAALNIVDLREVGGDKTDAVLDRYRPWVVDIIRLGDKLAGLPFAVSTPIMYYNRELMVEAGLDPNPSLTTWANVSEVAQALRDNTSIEAAVLGEANEWTAQTFIQNNGGRVLDDEGKAVFDSDEAIGGMQVWDQLRNDGHFVAMANDQMRPAFLAGNAAMYFSSVASLAAIKESAAFNLGTAEFPSTGDQAKSMPSGGNFLGVYTEDAEQQQAAWEFLDFVSSTEGATIWNGSGYMIATNDEIEMIEGQEPAYAQMDAGLTNETIWPGERGLEALVVFTDWMTRIVNGQTSVEEGMVEGNAAVADLLP